MLREEVLREWEKLKKQLLNYQDESFVIRTINDYQSQINQIKSKDDHYLSQIQTKEDLIKQLEMKIDTLTLPLEPSSTTPSSLAEKKLERVRNLVADNQMEKLKRLCKRGEI